ncbi:transient receptor potential cation channel subfamily M member-like 2, partial [Biomphalaria pfeifferi]
MMLLRSTDPTDKEAAWNARFNIEARLMQHVDLKRKERAAGFSLNSESKNMKHTPMVGLLIQGGPQEIDRVLWLLKKQHPVVVIRKKGFASGLIAYACYEGMKLGGTSQHLENIVKPQLTEKVTEAFPDYCQDNDHARLILRDKILECVKYAVQGDRRFLTVVDPSSSEIDLKDLCKYILDALVMAHSSSKGSREEIGWALKLSLHWNQCDFAAKKLLKPLEGTSIRIKDDLFMEALLLPNREQFVELFMDTGIVLHRLVSLYKLQNLYEKSLDNDFFDSICLDKVLNLKITTVDMCFLDEPNGPLDILIWRLTGLQKQMSATISFLRQPFSSSEKSAAEGKTILALIYWSVLTNRQSLAKVLWKKTSEPIAVALVISNMFYNLSKKWITDVDLQKNVKQAAIDFGTLAIEVMDLTFSDSTVLAYHALVNPIQEFNDRNVVDLAMMGNNIFFIAHPCCQRSMRERWMGHIRLKSFGRFPITIPENMKILLCVFLVFPMYFWLTFDNREQKNLEADDSTDEKKKLRKTNLKKKKPTFYNDPFSSVPIWRRVYFLYTAPITKFWINQLFLLAYLALFAYALMIPYCGDQLINTVLCCWTFAILVDHIVATTRKKMKYPSLDLFWPIQDILVDTVIVILLLYDVLAHNHWMLQYLPSIGFANYKLILAVCLIFSYLRALRYLFPVSRDLGPMLVNITLLTRKDLFIWFRLWSLCLISGALSIQFVVYPAQTVDIYAIGRAFVRALVGLFLTEYADMEGDAACSSLYQTTEVAHTCNAYVLARLEHCPHGSWINYFLLIQYLLITRLVYYTLMFAIFGTTIDRTFDRSIEIWKFQFYSLVTDFEDRMVIPVPLNLITYPFQIVNYGGKLCITGLFECASCLRGIQEQFKPVSKQQYSVPYNQWKTYMNTLAKREAEKEFNIMDVVAQLEEENNRQKLMTRRLTDRLVDIEQNQNMIGFVLEGLLNTLQSLDPKAQAQKAQTQARPIHIASRQARYPGTDITRFPVLEKDVPWEVIFEQYDPVTYSKPTEEYPLDFQMWVDPNVLLFQPEDHEYLVRFHPEVESSTLLGPTTNEDEQPVSTYVHFEPHYNAVQVVTLPNGKEGVIDRTSMITVNNQPLQYEIDLTGVPRNPMGRTGLRGRGNLYRWGPNPNVKAVISRWKSAAATGQQAGSKGNEKKMEIILSQEGADVRTVSLPSGIVNYGNNPYSTMCSLLLSSLFKEADLDVPTNFNEDEMIQYYSQFASSEMQKKNKSAYAYYGYSAIMVYRGYEDDPSNTDNAWSETEIWNFHYKYKDCFDNKLKE